MVRVAIFFALFKAVFGSDAGSGFASGNGGFLMAKKQTLEQQVASTVASLKADATTDKVEAILWKSSLSLPRNTDGRFDLPAVRYLVHTYFAQEHGWIIQGLGKHGPRANTSELHEAGILKDKAPVLLEALLDTRASGRGLSLRDTAMMAAALERLIITESLGFLELAYGLNALDVVDQITSKQLSEVMLSFLLLWELGQTEEVVSPDIHPLLKQELENSQDNFWQQLQAFQTDAQENFEYANRHVLNPFEQRFSFDMASQLVENLINGYGRWQDSECKMMKHELMNLDKKGFGRVPLSAFYSQPETAQYKFGESVEYLRTIGALDESSSKEPQVIVANFVAGPSNCVAGSEFFSVCCLSECESLMSEIEGQIKAPHASPEELLDLVVVMDSDTIDAPRRMPEELHKRLNKIAELNHGEVPLHGRLFAQWLHYAFPMECQNPSQLESEEVLSPAHWQEKGHSATEEEKEKYRAMADAAKDSSFFTVEEEHVPQWSEEDVLPFQRKKSLSYRMLMRCGMQLAMLAAALKAAYSAYTGASSRAKRPYADETLQKGHFV